MKNRIEGKVVSQNGVFLIPVQNKIMKSYAYITNQKDCSNLIHNKEYSFEIIGLNRVCDGYANLHIIKTSDVFNLIGTNGDVDSLKELLNADYIPNLVKLIKNK